MLEEMDVCVARLGGRHMRCRKASVGKWPGWPVSGIHGTDRSGERYICWLHDKPRHYQMETYNALLYHCVFAAN
jgi:hypothetical protein